jgi:hypothetical protein
MSNFPFEADVTAIRSWLDEKGFLAKFENWDADALIGVDKEFLLSEVPGRDGYRLWALLETARFKRSQLANTARTTNHDLVNQIVSGVSAAVTAILHPLPPTVPETGAATPPPPQPGVQSDAAVPAVGLEQQGAVQPGVQSDAAVPAVGQEQQAAVQPGHQIPAPPSLVNYEWEVYIPHRTSLPEDLYVAFNLVNGTNRFKLIKHPLAIIIKDGNTTIFRCARKIPSNQRNLYLELHDCGYNCEEWKQRFLTSYYMDYQNTPSPPSYYTI